MSEIKQMIDSCESLSEIYQERIAIASEARAGDEQTDEQIEHAALFCTLRCAILAAETASELNDIGKSIANDKGSNQEWTQDQEQLAETRKRWEKRMVQIRSQTAKA